MLETRMIMKKNANYLSFFYDYIVALPPFTHFRKKGHEGSKS